MCRGLHANMICNAALIIFHLAIFFLQVHDNTPLNKEFLFLFLFIYLYLQLFFYIFRNKGKKLYICTIYT